MSETLDKAKGAIREIKDRELDPKNPQYLYLVEVARVQAAIAQAEATENLVGVFERFFSEIQSDYPLKVEVIT